MNKNLKISISVDKKTGDIKVIENEFRGLDAQLSKTQKHIDAYATKIKKMAAGVVGFTAVVGGIRSSFSTFRELDSLITGIAKTTGLDRTSRELQGVVSQLDNLAAKKNGFVVQDLYAIAEGAGQLGIAKKDIASFTETIQKIKLTTGLTAEEASKDFARISNVLKEPISEIERLGSVYNELSNTTTASVRDLLYFSQRIGSNAKQFGMSTPEILGLSAAMKDMSINFEVGGSAVSKTIAQMQAKSQTFAKEMKVPFEEFSTMMKEKPMAALELFLQKLHKLEGGAKYDFLRKLGLGGTETATVLLNVSNNIDIVRKNIKIANNEYKVGASLQKEYAQASQSIDASLSRLSSNFDLLGKSIYTGYKDPMVDSISTAADLVNSLSENMDDIKTFSSYIAGAGAAFGTWKVFNTILPGMKRGMLQLKLGTMEATTAMRSGATASTVFATGIRSASTAMKNFGKANAPLLVLTALMEGWVYLTNQEADAQEQLQGALGKTVAEMEKMTVAQRDSIADGLDASLKEAVSTMLELDMEFNQAKNSMGDIWGATQEEVTALESARDTATQQVHTIREKLDVVNAVTDGTYQEVSALDSARGAAEGVTGAVIGTSNEIQNATSHAYDLASALGQAGANLQAAQASLSLAAGEISKLDALTKQTQSKADVMTSQKLKLSNAIGKAADAGNLKEVDKLTADILNTETKLVNLQTSYVSNAKQIADGKKREVERINATAKRETARITSSAKRRSASAISSRKSISRASDIARKEELSWDEKFTSAHNKATLSRAELQLQTLNKQKDDYLEHKQDALQVDEWYNAEVAKLGEKTAKKRKSVWGKDGKANELFKDGGARVAGIGGKDSAMSIAQQRKANEKAGKTFGKSFQESAFGKKSEMDFESFGSKFGDALGGALSGIFSTLASEGIDNAREVSREQFDSKIGGAIRSKYPMLSVAADLYSVMSSTSRNAFQKMDVNIDADNTGIADSLSVLSETMNPMLPYTKRMTNSLESMNHSFSTIAVGIASSTGMDITSSVLDQHSYASKGLFDGNGNLIQTSFGGNQDGLSQIINGFMDSLFGSTTKKLEAAGLFFGEQTAQSILDGVLAGSKYQDVKSTHKAAFGIISSTKHNTTFENLDQNTKDEYINAFTRGYDAILASSASLGLKNFDPSKIEFDEKKLQLDGKDISEQQKIITGMWTARLDKMALASFQDLKAYQVAGETDFTTQQRVGAQYEQAKYALGDLGLEAVHFTSVINKATGSFGLETARTSIMIEESAAAIGTVSIYMGKTVAENFTGIGDIIKTFGGSLAELLKLYPALIDTQIAMRLFSNDIVEINQTILNGAGGWEKFNSGFSTYNSNFLSEQEQNTIKMAQLSRQFQILNIEMPKSRDQFRAITQKMLQDPSDEAQKTYGKLIAISGRFADATKSAAEVVKELEESAKEAYDAVMKQVQSQTDLLHAENRLSDIKNENAREYERILKESAKTLRSLANSSDSAKDGIYNVGLSDNQSIQYYLNKINTKEAEYASFFDANGAIKAGKYEAMQSVHSEINSLTSTLTSSLENYDPDRREYLKENLFNMLNTNQYLANSNAKVMEVQVAGGTLDSIANDLNINEFATLVGLSVEQKNQLIAVANQTTGLAQEGTLTSRYAGESISVNQSNFVAPETGLLKDVFRTATYQTPYATVGVSNMIPSVETGLMRNSTFQAPYSTVGVSNISGARSDVSSLAKETTLGSRYAGQSIIIGNTAFSQSNFVAPETGLLKDVFRTSTYQTPYATVGVSNMIPSVETGLMRNSTFQAPYSNVGVSNISGARSDVSSLAKETTLGSRYAGQSIMIGNTAFSQSNFVAPETGLLKDVFRTSTYQTPYATVGVSNMIPSVETGLMRNSTFQAPYSNVGVSNISGARIDISTLAKETTLGSRYAGQSIMIGNTAFSGSTKLADILGASGSGLTGILNLTQEQKEKIALLESKATEEQTAQTYYTKAGTYFDTVLRDLAEKTATDARPLTAASFGATSTLGAQETVDFQSALGAASIVTTQAERDTLYSQLKGFATQTDDVSYLKTLMGYSDATGTVTNSATFAQIKALQSYLPSDATSAYATLKADRDSIYADAYRADGLMTDINFANWSANPQATAISAINEFNLLDIPETAHLFGDHGATFTGGSNSLTNTNLVKAHYKDVWKNLPQFFDGGSTGSGSPQIGFLAELHHQEHVVPHKGSLVMRENKNETRELKEIKRVLEETNMLNRKLLRVIQEWDEHGLKTIEAQA